MAPRFLKLVEDPPSRASESIDGSVGRHSSGRAATEATNKSSLKNVLTIFAGQPESVRHELAAEAKLFGFNEADDDSSNPQLVRDLPPGAVIDIRTGRMY